jgi:hypothetical protein
MQVCLRPKQVHGYSIYFQQEKYDYFPVIFMYPCLNGLLSESHVYFCYMTKEAVISAHTYFLCELSPSPWLET